MDGPFLHLPPWPRLSCLGIGRLSIVGQWFLQRTRQNVKPRLELFRTCQSDRRCSSTTWIIAFTPGQIKLRRTPKDFKDLFEHHGSFNGILLIQGEFLSKWQQDWKRRIDNVIEGSTLFFGFVFVSFAHFPQCQECIVHLQHPLSRIGYAFPDRLKQERDQFRPFVWKIVYDNHVQRFGQQVTNGFFRFIQ